MFGAARGTGETLTAFEVIEEKERLDGRLQRGFSGELYDQIWRR
jgi:hypothetical protein